MTVEYVEFFPKTHQRPRPPYRWERRRRALGWPVWVALAAGYGVLQWWLV